jgi:ligand-binding sensor domain-containing protein
MEDDLNNIWLVGSDGSVAKYNGFSFSAYGPAQGLKANGIYSIFQDGKKNIWFGSRDAGVFKYDGHQFINYSTQDGLPHNFINDIAEDAFGNIWLATDGGAARFDGKTFTSYSAIDGLGNVIGEVEYDSINKVIWFDTRIGLASLKMEQINDEKPLFQHYNPRTGFNFSITNNIL